MKDSNILIVSLSHRLRDYALHLRQEGSLPVDAPDMETALEFLKNRDFHMDLLLLDLEGDGREGLAMIEQIRRFSSLPILVTADREPRNLLLRAAQRGADDGLCFPFSHLLLDRKAEAILNRKGKTFSPEILAVGPFLADGRAHEICLDNKPLPLSPREYDLLLYLLRTEGDALSRERILANVWESDYPGGTRTVDTQIKQLRAKLGEWADCIQTVRKVGYRMRIRKEDGDE